MAQASSLATRVEQTREEDMLLIPGSRSRPEYRIHPHITHRGLDWYKTHEALHTEGLQMPNPGELIGLILFLQAEKPLYDGNGSRLPRGKADPLRELTLKNLLDERGPFRGAHLDAYFINRAGIFVMSYNHIIAPDGRIIPTEFEAFNTKLEDNGYVGLRDFSRAGLPIRPSKKQKYASRENIYVVIPEEGTVARFVASSGGVRLYCYRNPQYSGPGLGVFACSRASKR